MQRLDERRPGRVQDKQIGLHDARAREGGRPHQLGERSVAGQAEHLADLRPLQTEVELLVDADHGLAERRLQLLPGEELQPADGQDAIDLRRVPLREKEERGRKRRQQHLARHAHVPDDVGRGGDDRALLPVLGVAQRGRRLELDDHDAAQRMQAIEAPRGVQDILQARHVRQPRLKLRERELVEAREIRQEIVVERGDSAVTRELHVDLDDARSRLEPPFHRRHGVLDRPQAILAEIFAEAPVGDGERPHVQRQQEVGAGVERPSRRRTGGVGRHGQQDDRCRHLEGDLSQRHVRPSSPRASG